MASETLRGLTTPYCAESIDAFLEVLQGRRSIRTGFLRDKPSAKRTNGWRDLSPG